MIWLIWVGIFDDWYYLKDSNDDLDYSLWLRMTYYDSELLIVTQNYLLCLWMTHCDSYESAWLIWIDWLKLFEWIKWLRELFMTQHESYHTNNSYDSLWACDSSWLILTDDSWFIECVLNPILSSCSNSFLIHRPGIKKSAENKRVVNQRVVKNQNLVVKGRILPQLSRLFGTKKGCSWTP